MSDNTKKEESGKYEIEIKAGKKWKFLFFKNDEFYATTNAIIIAKSRKREVRINFEGAVKFQYDKEGNLSSV